MSRYVKLKPQICQDGGQFYHEPTGRIIANYNTAKHKQVLHDYDIEGAEQARRRFANDFPEFVVHED